MDKVFVPFMLGTISLILFFNVRNNYLGTRIREICNPIGQKKKKHGFSVEVAEQLYALMERYRRGSRSLVTAILAVTCFGTMLLLYFLLSPELYGLDRSETDPLIGLEIAQRIVVALFAIIGGALAAYASVYSISEIRQSRKSLWTHVAYSITLCNFTDMDDGLEQLRDILTKIEGRLETHISTSLYNDFKALTSDLRMRTNRRGGSGGT